MELKKGSIVVGILSVIFILVFLLVLIFFFIYFQIYFVTNVISQDMQYIIQNAFMDSEYFSIIHNDFTISKQSLKQRLENIIQLNHSTIQVKVRDLSYGNGEFTVAYSIWIKPIISIQNVTNLEIPITRKYKFKLMEAQ